MERTLRHSGETYHPKIPSKETGSSHVSIPSEYQTIPYHISKPAEGYLKNMFKDAFKVIEKGTHIRFKKKKNEVSYIRIDKQREWIHFIHNKSFYKSVRTTNIGHIVRLLLEDLGLSSYQIKHHTNNIFLLDLATQNDSNQYYSRIPFSIERYFSSKESKSRIRNDKINPKLSNGIKNQLKNRYRANSLSNYHMKCSDFHGKGRAFVCITCWDDNRNSNVMCQYCSHRCHLGHKVVIFEGNLNSRDKCHCAANSHQTIKCIMERDRKSSDVFFICHDCVTHKKSVVCFNCSKICHEQHNLEIIEVHGKIQCMCGSNCRIKN